MSNKTDTGECSGVKIMQLNDQKAGMKGLNKDIINKTIYEASKGTPYFIFQEKRQKSIDRRINGVLESMKRISPAERSESLHKINNLLADLESSRNLNHSIVHIDMDAFYAAVEMRDDPNLREKPMAVGSSSMLATSNYHARRFGVRAAMPGFIAKKLCPELVIIPCNFGKYRKASEKVRNIINDYDSDYSASSLDEVYFDLTEYIKKEFRIKFHKENCLKNTEVSESASCNFPNIDIGKCNKCQKSKQPVIGHIERDKRAFEIVQEIRQRIFEVTQLTASAGLAPNTMLAKVCSDQNKPNGQFQINSSIDDVKSFISTLPIKKVSGIGPVQSQILNSVGINTCADLWEKRDIVGILFSSNSVDFYMRVALGIGSTCVKSDYIRKSIGVEVTFRETHDPEELHKKCQDLCEEMIDDLKSHNMLGKVVILKMKTVDFTSHTRNHSLAFYTDDIEVITRSAKKLLDVEIAAVSPESLKLRLMGIRMANLVDIDSVPSNEKQHLKLKDFLQAKSSNSNKITEKQVEEDHNCPICYQQLHSSVSVFNEHVNQCMNELCESDNGENQSYINTEKNAEQFASSSTQNKSSLAESANDESSIEKLDPSLYNCPVCGVEQNVTELSDLNTHIDSCLNKKTIKEILLEESNNKIEKGVSQKRKKSEIALCAKSKVKKHKALTQMGRRIEEYFK